MIMTIAKNIEVSSTSETSFEDAIQKGVARIAKTVNISLSSQECREYLIS